jgi:hypothetical protein
MGSFDNELYTSNQFGAELDCHWYGAAPGQIQISGTYLSYSSGHPVDWSITWGDGNSDSSPNTASIDITHLYATEGPFTVTIQGGDLTLTFSPPDAFQPVQLSTGSGYYGQDPTLAIGAVSTSVNMFDGLAEGGTGVAPVETAEPSQVTIDWGDGHTTVVTATQAFSSSDTNVPLDTIYEYPPSDDTRGAVVDSHHTYDPAVLVTFPPDDAYQAGGYFLVPITVTWYWAAYNVTKTATHTASIFDPTYGQTGGGSGGDGGSGSSGGTTTSSVTTTYDTYVGPVQYTFDPGDLSGLIGPQTSPVMDHTYTVPGTYTVTVKAEQVVSYNVFQKLTSSGSAAATSQPGTAVTTQGTGTGTATPLSPGTDGALSLVFSDATIPVNVHFAGAAGSITITAVDGVKRTLQQTGPNVYDVSLSLNVRFTNDLDSDLGAGPLPTFTVGGHVMSVTAQTQNSVTLTASFTTAGSSYGTSPAGQFTGSAAGTVTSGSPDPTSPSSRKTVAVYASTEIVCDGGMAAKPRYRVVEFSG